MTSGVTEEISRDLRVRALVAIALTERLAHELAGYLEQLDTLIEAEREAQQ